MKKLALILCVVTGIVAGIFWKIQVLNSRETTKKQGVETIQKQEGYPVVLTEIKRGPFEVWREIYGKVEGYQQAFITTSDLARVASIEYKAGDFVTADKPIIKLDENDPKNRSRIKLLRSVHEDALNEYNRYKSLFDSGGISQGALDKIELKLEQAKTNLDAAITTVYLSSPFSGTLIALYTRVGENVMPNKTLAIVSSLEKVRIVVAVSDREVAAIKKGRPVKVTAADGTEMKGHVDRISMGANPVTGLFDIDLVVNNKNRRLKVGTFVTAKTLVFRSEEAAYIDSGCVLKDIDNNDFIFQVENNRARRVAVHVKAQNDKYSLIEGSFSFLPVAGSGQEFLDDGVAVKIVGQIVDREETS